MKSYQPSEGYDRDGYAFQADDFEIYDDERKRKRPKKEAGQPKNARSAYVYFCEVSRPSIAPKGTHPAETMKLLGRKWQRLSEEDRKPFEAKHEKDKARYEIEMKEWREGKRTNSVTTTTNNNNNNIYIEE